MSPTESPRRIVALAGLLVSAAFVWMAVRHLDTHAIAQVWKTARPLPWLPVAVLSYVVGHFVRGQRLRYLVRSESRLQLVTASNVVVVGYASNNVLPARLGELVRAGMLAERTGIPLAQTVTITFIERLVDGVAILFLLVAGTLVAPVAGWIRDLARVGAIVFGCALLGLGVAVILPRIVISLTTRLARPLGPKWRDRVLGLVTSIVNAGACLRRPQDALVIGSLSVVVWLLESLMFVCVLPTLGIAPRLSLGIIAMSVTNLGILVPSTPGFIGPFHFFCSQALIAQGFDGTTALAYAALVHLAFYIPATAWGAGAMLWYGVQVGETVARARAARRSPSTKVLGGIPVHVIARVERDAPEAKPSDFDVAVTEALLPRGFRPSARLIQDVATFLAGEIDALPPRIRALYHAGMTTFRFYVRLRYVRSFCGLSLERRRSAVDSWAFGPIALLRQLFRPARSTVLLACYEHDEAAAALAGDDVVRLPIAADAAPAAGGAHG